MIIGRNEWKTLTSHISCKCKCKFDGRKFQINGWMTLDIDMSVKKRHVCEKIIFGTLLHAVLKMENI